jgi:Flp pilus assembly protein TadD
MLSHEITDSSRPLRGVSAAWVFGVLLILATVAVFGPVIHYEFVAWDDDIHVYANPRLLPATWEHVLAFWQAPYEHLYIPWTYTVWATVAWLTQTLLPGPLRAGPFHGLNLLLHLGSVLVVYRLVLLLLHQAGNTTRQAAGAAIGALLFGLHPLQVEAMAWVSGLKDVLGGSAALVAVWQYLEFTRVSGDKRRWLHYGLATAAFGFAILAKPAAVVAPGIAGLLAVWGLGQPWRQTLRALGGWLVVAIAWGVWTKQQQPDVVMAFLAPLWTRPAIAADALGFYLGKLLWPMSLGPDYGRTPQVVLGQGWGWIPPLGLLGLGLFVWQRRQQWRVLVLAAALFVVGLLPVLGLVPFVFQAHSTVADRYVYLALLGPALGLGWGVHRLGHRGLVWVGGVLILGVLGGRSAAQVQVWQDTVTLFTHAIEVNPRSALAHNNLGLALAQQGNLNAAIPHYLQALRLRPDYAYTHNNLGLALTRQGRLDEAIVHYTEALRLQPDYVEAYNNLGLALVRQGQPDKAVVHLTRALSFSPDQAGTHNSLGIALAAQGNYAAAIDRFARAIQLQPAYAKAYYNLGLALAHEGRPEEAIVALRVALRLQPVWPQAASNLALVLVTQTAPAQQALTEAISLAEQACQAAAHRDAFAMYALAVTYRAAGDDTRAFNTAEQALTLATAAGDSAMAARITTQFPLVAQKEPVHALP